MFETLSPKKLILPAALALLAAGCVPHFQNPPPASEKRPVDCRLFAVWAGTDGKDAVQATVLPREGKWMSLVLLEDLDKSAAEGGVDATTLDAFATRLGGRDFLCVKPRYLENPSCSGVGSPPEDWYALFYYTVSSDHTLTVRQLSADFLQKAIEGGKLAGTVKKEKYSTGLTITASSEELGRFLSTADLDLLLSKEEPLTLKRVKVLLSNEEKKAPPAEEKKGDA